MHLRAALCDQRTTHYNTIQEKRAEERRGRKARELQAETLAETGEFSRANAGQHVPDSERDQRVASKRIKRQARVGEGLQHVLRSVGRNGSLVSGEQLVAQLSLCRD